jgi:hypothetical protein
VAKVKKQWVDLGGFLVYEKVRDLKVKFDKISGSQKDIEVRSELITEIDLTGIQLIQYFLLKANEHGKTLRFAIQIADEPRQLMEKNGYTNLLQKLIAC